MLCLVRQPNDVVLEVQVDHKAKGQECLDKVCKTLGIIEVDYFGLQYFGQHGELLWMNLRNPVKQQLTGPPPYRLQLKVKFFVPPHLLLQETTRFQFFLSILRDLHEGRMRVTDKSVALKLTAFAAQSYLGDLDLLNQSLSSALLAYPKWLPLCVRDPVEGVTPGIGVGISSPLTTRKGKRRKHHSGNSETETSSDSSEEMAFACDHCQTEVSATVSSTSSFPGTLCEKCSDNELPRLCNIVMQLHRQLKDLKPPNARYLFLKEVSELDSFGVEYFAVRSNCSSEKLFRLGVGPKGVNVTLAEDPTEVKHSIPYSSIHIATHSGRCLFLTYIEGNGDPQPLGFKCESCQAANAIYRAVTEKHAFYSCETVRNAVTSQFIRDLKGTIVSLFNENTALGKNYVFDIRRTCREVYDHTRRALYQLEISPEKQGEGEEGTEGEDEDSENGVHCLPMEELNQLAVNEIQCLKSRCKDFQARLESLQDSMLCRVCMDADVSIAFFPCRHVVCCSNCAPLCDKCPLCRSLVQTSEHIYLPVTGNRLGHRQSKGRGSPLPVPHSPGFDPFPSSPSPSTCDTHQTHFRFASHPTSSESDN